MKKNIDYSIVVPVLKSEATIAILCQSIAKVFSTTPYSFEIILVNDAGHKATWQSITNIQEKATYSISAIHLSRHLGQHFCTYLGMRKAQGNFVITIDDDLQFLPEEILWLIDHQKSTGADMIYGLPIQRQHSILKIWGSKAAIYLFHLILKTPKQGSAFRLVNAIVLPEFFKVKKYPVFIDAWLAKSVRTRAYLNVSHAPRRHGKSGYTVLKLTLWTLHVLQSYLSKTSKVFLLIAPILLSLLLFFLAFTSNRFQPLFITFGFLHFGFWLSYIFLLLLFKKYLPNWKHLMQQPEEVIQDKKETAIRH